MLTLCTGADRTALSRHLADKLVRQAAAEPGQILLVPEQFSHEAERTLCQGGGDGISRYARLDKRRTDARRQIEQAVARRAQLAEALVEAIHKLLGHLVFIAQNMRANKRRKLARRAARELREHTSSLARDACIRALPT